MYICTLVHCTCRCIPLMFVIWVNTCTRGVRLILAFEYWVKKHSCIITVQESTILAAMNYSPNRPLNVNEYNRTCTTLDIHVAKRNQTGSGSWTTCNTDQIKRDTQHIAIQTIPVEQTPPGQQAYTVRRRTRTFKATEIQALTQPTY